MCRCPPRAWRRALRAAPEQHRNGEHAALPALRFDVTGTRSSQSIVSVPVTAAPISTTPVAVAPVPTTAPVPTAAPISMAPVTAAPISTAPVPTALRSELRGLGRIRRIAFRGAGFGCVGSGRIRRDGLGVDGRRINRPCLSRRQQLWPRKQEYSRQPDARQRVAPGQNRRVVVAVASTSQDFASLAPIHGQSLRRTCPWINRLETEPAGERTGSRSFCFVRRRARLARPHVGTIVPRSPLWL